MNPVRNKRQVLASVERHIKAKFAQEGTGHDWWHIDRVRKVALRIGKAEKADLFVVELAALLHDIADWKFHNGDGQAGGRETAKLLSSLKVPQDIVDQVTYIVDNISFKLGLNKHKMKTVEGKVVQDADRLDAIGAVGIARVFAYGGYKNRSIYDPTTPPNKSYRSLSQAKKSLGSGTSINHFYEKLLLLKGLMNTKTGKSLAATRHKFMEKYLDQFFAEWNGKR